MANKFLGEAGVDQLVNEMQQRYDKLDSFMVLDPSNKSKFMQILLSYTLAPVYCPIIFIKDVLVTMTSLIGVGSAVKFTKSPGTVSPICLHTAAAQLNFNDNAIKNICDNFANANPGDTIATLNYNIKNNTIYRTIVLFNVTKINTTVLDSPIEIAISTIHDTDTTKFDEKLNQSIESHGADSGVIVNDLNPDLVKVGNVIQIDGTLFSIQQANGSIMSLIPLEITAAEVTEKFNS